METQKGQLKKKKKRGESVKFGKISRKLLPPIKFEGRKKGQFQKPRVQNWQPKRVKKKEKKEIISGPY